MNKEEIMNDIEFRKVCNKFGLDWSDFEVFDDLIVLKTPVNDLYVFLDSNYNIVEIEKCTLELNDETCKQMSFNYENLIDFIQLGDHAEYPFNEFTLKQINDIANRVNIKESNHGHSIQFEINKEWYKNDKQDCYLQLISYIKFLYEEINLYWENTYSLRILKFDVPDIYYYLTEIVNKVNECININIVNNNRPYPADIMNYIGQNNIYNQNPTKFNSLLYNIIDLLMREKGKKSVVGTFHDIENINEEEKLPNLSAVAIWLLEILKVPQEETKKNIEKTRSKQLNK